MSDLLGQHVPVLLGEVGELLAVRTDARILDCTIGLGGHARALAAAAGGVGLLLGLDVDEALLAGAARNLDGCGCPFRLFRCNFRSFPEVLAEAGVETVDTILADLGVSSLHLDDAARGFSFQHDGPLDMRLDTRLRETAADLVNRLSETDLADLIYRNAEERLSRRIARAIHRARHRERITTTRRLSEIVAGAQGIDPQSRPGKIHPATRTFQALRIAVNDELGALDQLLAQVPRYLRPGGRFGIISFHSLEDLRVKRDFLSRKAAGVYEIVTKKPVTATAAECAANSRSRSAKLRVALRTDRDIQG